MTSPPISPISAVLAVLAVCVCTVTRASLGIEPDCPAATDVIAIAASGPTVQSEPLSVEVVGTTVKLVAQAYNSGFTLPPFTQVVGQVPPLGVGKYRLEFYTRIQPSGAPGGDPATLLPARLEESMEFEVFAVPPTCSPVNVEVVSTSFVSAEVNGAYSADLRFLVTDAHGNVVPNYSLSVERVYAASEAASSARPDVAMPVKVLHTGLDGVAVLGDRANSVPGAFQYRAYVFAIARQRSAYGTFYNRPVGSVSPKYPVIEYVRNLPLTGHVHFFMTGNSVEAASLDRGTTWQRTGETLMAFAPGMGLSGTARVCRFYGLPAAGLDSHFFSAAADECDAVAKQFGSAWMLETSDAFEVYLPNRDTGECPAGTRRLYRAYNQLPDANHRYAFTHDVALLNGHPPDGPYWTLEGYGPDSVAMCLPQ